MRWPILAAKPRHYQRWALSGRWDLVETAARHAAESQQKTPPHLDVTVINAMDAALRISARNLGSTGPDTVQYGVPGGPCLYVTVEGPQRYRFNLSLPGRQGEDLRFKKDNLPLAKLQIWVQRCLNHQETPENDPHDWR